MNASELSALYDRYFEEAAAAERNRKPMDGLLGFGKKPQDDPCHDRFLDSVRDWLKDYSDTSPESSSVRDVLSRIYFISDGLEQSGSAYWMLFAIHGLTLDLIPFLSSEDAAALKDRYARSFPRYTRLPVQKQVFKALEKQAGR